MRTTCGIILAAGLACMAVPVAAHHGFDTEYDSTKTIGATGVVSKVEWTNPHMHVYVDVTDAGGKVKTYNLELTSPNAIQRQGWNKNDLLAGEKVTFKAHAGKVEEARAALDSLVKVSAPNQEIFKGPRPD
jgi:predicted amidohydrolase